MKFHFSVHEISRKCAALVQRFPITIGLLIGFALLLFGLANDSTKEMPPHWFAFFLVGVLISATATLWLENFFNTYLRNLVTLVAVALWGLYCFFLPTTSEAFHLAKGIEIFVIGAVAFLSMFFISFLKKDNDIAFWNFSVKTIFNCGLAVFFAVILYGGLALATYAVEQLFGLELNKAYLYAAILCFECFAPLYVLANMPDKTAKHNNAFISETKYWKILAMYILSPLAAIYLVILYIYLFKIMFAWELPNGGVSWLMSVLASGGLAVIGLLYPVRLQEKQTFTTFVSRYFGVIILPLLVLMSIAIFYRINEYGLTINRCYMLLLNLWFYGIYAYLFITKSRHIKWILISAATIALLASVSFWSIPNITKRALTADLNHVLNNQKISLTDQTFLKKMDVADKENIKEKLDYLATTYGTPSVQPFFADTVEHFSPYQIKNLLDENGIAVENGDWFSFEGETNKIWELNNFDAFISVDYGYSRKSSEEDAHVSWEDGLLQIEHPASHRMFSIPLQNRASEHLRKGENIQTMDAVFQGADYTFILRNFYGNYYKQSDVFDVSAIRGDLFYHRSEEPL